MMAVLTFTLQTVAKSMENEKRSDSIESKIDSFFWQMNANAEFQTKSILKQTKIMLLLRTVFLPKM